MTRTDSHDGRALIVTGASRGIGAATAHLAARHGYAVCVNYRQARDAADSVVDGIRAAGGRAIAVQADVAEAILWLLSPASAFTTGSFIEVSGGR